MAIDSLKTKFGLPPKIEMKIIIAEDSKSKHRIVVSDDASPGTKHGAKELQTHLKEMTNADLPIVSDKESMGEYEIIVGNNAHLKELKLNIDFLQLGKEGFVLRTVGHHLVIAGGEPRGNMYGVYQLLDQKLGCRWFTPTISSIPKYKVLEVGPLNETIAPLLAYRSTSWTPTGNQLFCARCRINYGQSGLAQEYGGETVWAPGYGVHTFNKLVPPEKYAASHPEYYSQIEGTRLTSGRTQLCCTNEEVVKIVTDRVRELFREHSEAQIISVSQNDWGAYCTCPECAALDEKEGTHAAQVLYLVNRVAAGIEPEFPDKQVETLAYQWTRHPPRTMKPCPNVVIRLCTIECSFSTPMVQGKTEQNARFREDIVGWAEISPTLWMWDYTTNYRNYLQPLANWRIFRDNLQFYTRNKVRGIYEQGNRNSPGAEDELKTYLLGRYMWNPSYDEDKAINEFCEGVYEPAAPHVLKYLDLMAAEAAKGSMRIFDNFNAEYLNPAVMAKANACWDEAAKAVEGNPELEKRVLAGRLPVDYVYVMQNQEEVDGLLKESKCGQIDPDYLPRLKQFLTAAKLRKVTSYREGSNNFTQIREPLEQLQKQLEAV